LINSSKAELEGSSDDKNEYLKLFHPQQYTLTYFDQVDRDEGDNDNGKHFVLVFCFSIFSGTAIKVENFNSNKHFKHLGPKLNCVIEVVILLGWDLNLAQCS